MLPSVHLTFGLAFHTAWAPITAPIPIRLYLVLALVDGDRTYIGYDRMGFVLAIPATINGRKEI
jgi:hypothetical protein